MKPEMITMDDDLDLDHPLPQTVWFPEEHGETHAAYLQARPDKLAGKQLIMDDLAQSAADLCDSARINQDPRLWLAASRVLIALTDKVAGKEDPVAGVQETLMAALGEGPQ